MCVVKILYAQEIICSILTISKTLMHVYLQITILYYKHLNRYVAILFLVHSLVERAGPVSGSLENGEYDDNI